MTTKRKNCKPEKSYNCGNSCISARFVCRKDGLAGQSVSIVNKLSNAIEQVGATPPSPEKSTFEKNISAYEESLLGNEFETMGIFNEAGELIMEEKGDDRSVTLPPALNTMAQAERSLVTLTHNHPPSKDSRGTDAVRDGASFSGSDVSVFLSRNLKGMRAISDKYVHIIERPTDKEFTVSTSFTETQNAAVDAKSALESTWLAEREKGMNAVMDQILEIEADRSIPYMERATKVRQLEMDTADTALHRANEIVAEQYGYNYKRVPRGN